MGQQMPVADSRYYRVRGDRLKALRIDKGWSIEELAARAICSVRTIQSAEKSSRTVLATIAKLAKALAVEVRELMADPPPAFQEVPERATGRIEVHINLNISFENFDETEPLILFIEELSRQAATKGAIVVNGVASGSVAIILSMDREDATSLILRFSEGKLDDRIAEIRLLGRRAEAVFKETKLYLARFESVAKADALPDGWLFTRTRQYRQVATSRREPTPPAGQQAPSPGTTTTPPAPQPPRPASVWHATLTAIRRLFGGRRPPA